MRARAAGLLAVLVLAVLVLAATACTGGSGDTAGTGACDGSARLTAKGVLRCLHDSVAYIETDIASGSGFVVAGGYVVTNAHVVDPFDRATVVFEGDRRFTDVPVKAVDLLADLALLGPITGLPAAPPLATGQDLEQGDPVFLVGYPGETERDAPAVTISQGIVARFRTADPFGLRYVQTDAAISGGQSGGALVDDHGRVVGVSGLSFAERFALALRGDDVQRAVDALRSSTTPVRAIAPSGGVSAGAVRITEPTRDLGLLVLRGAAPGSTVELTFADPAAAVLALDGETFDAVFATDAAFARYDEITGAETSTSRDQYRRGRTLAPGRFEITVPSSGQLEVWVMSSGRSPIDLAFRSSQAVQVFSDDDQDEPIRVGDTLDRTMRYTEWSDTFVIDLAAGDRITVFVGSPSADMGFAIVAPGETPATAAYVDGSGLGMLGLDEETTFTARVAGRHVISVAGDEVSSAYRIRVTKG